MGFQTTPHTLAMAKTSAVTRHQRGNWTIVLLRRRNIMMIATSAYVNLISESSAKVTFQVLAMTPMDGNSSKMPLRGSLHAKSPMTTRSKMRAIRNNIAPELI